MWSCQHLWSLTLLLLNCSLLSILAARPPQESADPAADTSKFMVITEDVIGDGENSKKVIRVNPLDLPPIKYTPSGSMDSTLFKIQSLLPPRRDYVNSNGWRRKRPTHQPNSVKSDQPGTTAEAKVQKVKQDKRMRFLYDQSGEGGAVIDKSMHVHVAPGAYPVYYVVAKSNGRFGKLPLKGFRNEAEFQKYLQKAKLVPLEPAKLDEN